MLVTFTDFGVNGPYLGQVKGVLHGLAPGVPVVDLFVDAPAFDPVASAHLLAAYGPELPVGSVFLCVVDPGVGTDARAPVVVRADGRYFVGPDNGLFHVLAARAGDRARWRLTAAPRRLSATFHGRDLFAPAAAMIARGEWPQTRPEPWSDAELAGAGQDLAQVIYLDGYGNAVTGLRAANAPDLAWIGVGDARLPRAGTFAEVGMGEAFWYENSSGLVEVAVNQGSAAARLRLAVGSPVVVIPPTASGAAPR